MAFTTLAIMAAGIGARYGGGIKQLESVGPNGEIIIDYSIHDAIEAGFDKLVLIIRRDIETDFREVIGNRIEKFCASHGVEVAYAFQALEDVPAGISVPPGRKKPWGTGQAILACRDLIREPFAVINADDYYGKSAYRALNQFLVSKAVSVPNEFCMAGFALENTVSSNGGVTRGVCHIDGSGYLTDITEIHNIVPKGTQGEGFTESLSGARETVSIPLNSTVSMNMWGFPPAFLDMLAEEFPRFFANIRGNEQKAEFLIPVFIGKLLERGLIRVQSLRTPDKWFGITYRDDLPAVREAFRTMHENGTYPMSHLFSDLAFRRAV